MSSRYKFTKLGKVVTTLIILTILGFLARFNPFNINRYYYLLILSGLFYIIEVIEFIKGDNPHNYYGIDITFLVVGLGIIFMLGFEATPIVMSVVLLTLGFIYYLDNR